ncbi:MAG: hypothetical protein M0R66_05400 [Candidatus Omnitrophica bacterium]|nr:hypothetical protein [Candidatus Omnitrophota bacterium]
MPEFTSLFGVVAPLAVQYVAPGVDHCGHARDYDEFPLHTVPAEIRACMECAIRRAAASGDRALLFEAGRAYIELPAALKTREFEWRALSTVALENWHEGCEIIRLIAMESSAHDPAHITVPLVASYLGVLLRFARFNERDSAEMIACAEMVARWLAEFGFTADYASAMVRDRLEMIYDNPETFGLHDPRAIIVAAE